MIINDKFNGILILNLTVIFFSAGCRSEVSDNVRSFKTKGENIWIKEFEFDPSSFKSPPQEFGPFTRWWWPGNDVTKEELTREINLLADNGFAGVEIQPFTRGLNPEADKEEMDRVCSWDTPSFYENLIAVLELAKIRGIIVDLNGGSGWPSGGPHIKQEDNILNLGYSSVSISGGKKIEIDVPEASMRHRPVSMGGIPIKYALINRSLARLQAVTAAKIVTENKDEPVKLDPESAIDISKYVFNNKIIWDVPKGNWKIVAFWAYPAGEIPVLIAKRDPGLVVDHLDSSKVIKNYEYLFGRRTGLETFYGAPLRAIFNDSYEFKVDRHYSADFLSIFRRNRNYDIIPWLPANMQAGYNNHAESAYYPNQKPDFYFSEEDWRLQYDYDLTLSDLLQIHFFSSTRNWLENRGMLHRTQPYGLHMDIIAASGNSSIPETEQLYSEGSEGFMKLVTSGAHLYNRPVITAESFVYRYRGEMTTPQKIKISIDKAVAAGVNQIIYHGTSYKYMTDDFSSEGWNAWDSPFTPNITYSSNIKETDNFWKDIHDINKYIRRVQYAMRSGKPKSDVLIYFPFLGVESRELMSNPEELLPLGYFKGVEPESVIPAFGAPPRTPAESTVWYHKIWGIINTLEAAGITWEFTNDISLQDATHQQGMIDIRGNRYQALILPYIPYIQITTARCIRELCKKGVKLLVIGQIPKKQPGFMNYAGNDLKTYQYLEEALHRENSRHILNESDFEGWTKEITSKIRFRERYGFLRQIHREMSDNSRLHFIWNKSDVWHEISLETDEGFPNKYWLDAETGIISKVQGREISYLLPPYGTILFFATSGTIPGNLLSELPCRGYNGRELSTIQKWNISAGGISIRNSSLFDWRLNGNFRYKPDDGIYQAAFNLEKKESNSRYFIDLGTVYYTAEIRINGQYAGKRIFAPFELDITPHLREGKNSIEVRVTPAQRNHSIGEALKGNQKYAQFRNLENTLMPAGIIGPVVLRQVR